MKIAKFLAFAAMGAVAFSSVSCSDDDDDDNNPVTPAEAVITLSSTTASVEVGKTVTLTATTANVPDGTAIVWISSDDNVATVVDGTVTGVAEGTATISAAAAGKTASCTVTVTKKDNGGSVVDHASLQGTNYNLFFLDATSREKVAGKIDADFAIDDTEIHWWIWDNTYAAQDPVGKNFYGVAGEGWMSMTVTNVGWSGAGWACDKLTEMNKLGAIFANPEGYFFHIAMKSTDNAVHALCFGGSNDTDVKVAIGGDYVDNGVTYVKYADLTRDGEWNEIEIPMSYLFDKGLVYSDNNEKGANLVYFLSGGTSGVSLQFDAMFIYKKK